MRGETIVEPGCAARRMQRVLRAAALLAVLAGRGKAQAAPAHPKEACFAAYEEAQRLRAASQLRAAHTQLQSCLDPACPAALRADCTGWLTEVEKATPSVVVSGRDEQGNPTVAVAVSVDGSLVKNSLDGRSLAIDPGSHVFRFSFAGREKEENVLLLEGEKDHLLVADFRPPPGAAVSALSPAPSPPGVLSETQAGASRATHSQSCSVWVYVLGGVSVVGLASFSTFALMGKSVQGCAPDCTRGQVDDLRRDYAVADVSLLLALAAAGGAVYGLLASPGVGPATQRTGAAWSLHVHPERGGAGLGLSYRF